MVSSLRAFGHDPRVGAEHPVHVGVDLADLGVQRGRQRHRGGVRAAPAQGGDVLGVGRDALEAGHDRDVAGGHRVLHPGRGDALDPGLAVHRGGEHPGLRAGERLGRSSPASGSPSPAGPSRSARRRSAACRTRGRTGTGATCSASSISSSVVSPIAETTTTTSWPSRRVATIRSATRLIRSASATDEPPYFCTTSPTVFPPDESRPAGPAKSRRRSSQVLSTAIRPTAGGARADVRVRDRRQTPMPASPIRAPASRSEAAAKACSRMSRPSPSSSSPIDSGGRNRSTLP